jgi:hypothetical protein
MKKLMLVLIAAVLVAGCTGQPPSTNQGGGTNVEAADVMVATNEATIPASPAADTDFTARFTVKNQHKANKAENVGVWIYDTGKCTITKIGGLDATKVGGLWPGLAIETANNVIQHTADFAAGQEELVKLDMMAPTSAQIGGLSYNCLIRYLVNYSFAAKSSMTVDVMSADRLRQVETQLGSRPTYTRTLNVGAGPIRILMEPTSAMPIEAGKKLAFEITLKNEGTGDYASVLPGQLSFQLPKEFVAILNSNNLACGGFFDSGTEKDSIKNFTNHRKIDLIEKQANPITCEFNVPTSVSVEQEYVITSELPYLYGYFGEEISVPITP